jgi:hypothetical protein
MVSAQRPGNAGRAAGAACSAPSRLCCRCRRRHLRIIIIRIDAGARPHLSWIIWGPPRSSTPLTWGTSGAPCRQGGRQAGRQLGGCRLAAGALQ